MSRYLLDTSVWWRFVTSGPLDPKAIRLLNQHRLDLWLSPLSVMGVERKIALGKLVEPNVTGWREQVVAGFHVAELTFAAARLAAQWSWEHRDPWDRMLAAIAKTEDLTLLHTDTVLKELSGFPQRYFAGVAE